MNTESKQELRNRANRQERNVLNMRTIVNALLNGWVDWDDARTSGVTTFPRQVKFTTFTGMGGGSGRFVDVIEVVSEKAKGYV